MTNPDEENIGILGLHNKINYNNSNQINIIAIKNRANEIEIS